MIAFDLNTPTDRLQAYLAEKGFLDSTESIIEISKAGEGNMNVVLRVRTSGRSLILKQSRPYVQKYPDIPAPAERIAVERQFYQALASSAASPNLPEILGYDAAQYLLVMEDLGAAEDMTSLYNSRHVEEENFQTLITVLSAIHCSSPDRAFPENLELRRLNHQHIFVLPFQSDNGFQLDEIQPGLEALAQPFRSDSGLLSKISTLGERYLSQGSTLLHGDYYPGSWLKRDDKIYVIDPEFSFMGFAEFDLGVMAAHLTMASMDPDWVSRCLEAYPGKARADLVCHIAGTEILRRLIGLAQLPLERSLDEKAFLLNQARILLTYED